MKKTITFLMAGIAVSLLVNSQALAFSEDDMMEGMSLSVESSQKNYKYDNETANVEESMTEFNFFPENDTITGKYAGDPTCPTAHHIVSEGICLTHLAQELASR